MYLAIRRATDEDTDSVLKITKESFSLYQEDLHVKYEVKALKETIESTLHDIRENAVFVVERFGSLVGAIRIKKLSNELWYVYRFGVSPQISNTGFGSALLDAAITCPILLRQTVLRPLHDVRPRLCPRVVRARTRTKRRR